MALKFNISAAKGLKLNVRKYWGLIFTFAKVTKKKLVEEGAFCSPHPQVMIWHKQENVIKGAAKLYFTHYSCVVIFLFNMCLDKSAFCIYSLRKLVFRLSVLSVFSACSAF